MFLLLAATLCRDFLFGVCSFSFSALNGVATSLVSFRIIGLRKPFHEEGRVEKARTRVDLANFGLTKHPSVEAFFKAEVHKRSQVCPLHARGVLCRLSTIEIN